MKNRERILVSSIFAVLAFGWLGFLLHISPEFAGSSLGAVFGISGAVLMLVPLVYVFAKRAPFFEKRITKYVSLQMWLSIHIYTGIVGALFALIHTGHKYNSPLGIALTATMLLVVVSGFVLRYLTPFVNLDMRDKLLLLQTARGDLDSAWGVLENSPAEAKALPRARLLAAGLASLGIDLSTARGPAAEVTRLAESVADLEYAIRSDEFFKRCFSWALKVHIVLSMLFYGLLALHIWAEIYFGLRWFS